MKRGVLAAVFLAVLCLARNGWAGLLNEKAPEFSLQGLNGSTVNLKDYRGKVVFIDFWASWCAPCKKEFPEINRVSERYNGKDVVFIAVNIDKKRSHADDFLAGMKSLSRGVVVLLDAESSVIKTYNAAAMPTSFIVDKSGVVRYIHFGFRESDPSIWTDEIDKLLK